MTQSAYRVERDFLGVKEVPRDAYYGIQTLRAIENFPITGYRLDDRLIIAMSMVKKAAALANVETGELAPDLGHAIAKAAGEIMEGRWHESFLVDPIQGGAGTSINMNANEVIANRAIELLGLAKGDYSRISPNSHVNMSQSTNDTFPTAAHIAALMRIDKLLYTLESLHDGFAAKAREFDGVIKMGRTHLQDAVPIRLGQEFEAYRHVVARDIIRIRRTKEHLLEVNMGATAVGTGLNAEPLYIRRVVELLAEISGYPLRNAEHLPDATQNTDAYTELSGALKICMINMSKIASDIRLMASGPRAGLAEINLPPLQPGSSIMPGKVNPVMCEAVNQVAFQVIGNDHTIGMASEAGQLELNVMEPVLIFNLLQSLGIMDKVLNVFLSRCLMGITANEEHCREYAMRSVGLITALNPRLGYETAARIAREAILTGRSVRDLCLEHKVLNEMELDRLLDPYGMTQPGVGNGIDVGISQ